MVQDVTQLADSQLFILRALGAYRFLTVKQMLKLDYAISRTQLYAKLKPMRDDPKPLIKAIDFGSAVGMGRLDVVYFLSDLGAKVLGEISGSSDTINYPKRVRTFNNDYLHRMSAVDFHIALNMWCKQGSASLDHYASYYDDGKKGRDGQALQKTTITHAGQKIVPDALFGFTAPDGISRLCAFELHNGDDAGRLLKQIEVYCAFLKQRAIEAVYGYPHSLRVLIVFEHKKCPLKAKEMFTKREDLQPYQYNFFLKSTADIGTEDFQQNWTCFYSEDPQPLFVSS